MRVLILVVCLLLSAALGCAALFHRPRPDLELALDERPWRVRCGWTLPAEPGAPPIPRHSGVAWASDGAQRRLIAAGRVEDGFFPAPRAITQPGDGERSRAPRAQPPNA